jgi:hypothetical protein
MLVSECFTYNKFNKMVQNLDAGTESTEQLYLFCKRTSIHWDNLLCDLKMLAKN